MAKPRTVFFCSACGHESTRWLGRCPACDAWNTFAAAPAPLKAQGAGLRAVSSPARAPVRLGDVPADQLARIPSGFGEFDALLGGGIVPGSLILVGGPPGAGKSTLLLQVAARLPPSARGRSSTSAARSRPRRRRCARMRLGASDELLLFAETDLDAILDRARTDAPARARHRFDSDDGPARGRVVRGQRVASARVRRGADGLREAHDCATFVVGHVTKDGAIAGPATPGTSCRYGALFRRRQRRRSSDRARAQEPLRQRRRDLRLHARRTRRARSPQPVATLFGPRSAARRASGSCVVASIVGSRPVLVEIQALVGETGVRHAATSRREHRSRAPRDDPRRAGTARGHASGRARRLLRRSRAAYASTNPPPTWVSRSRSPRRFAAFRCRRARPPSARSGCRARCAPSRNARAASPKRRNSASRT